MKYSIKIKILDKLLTNYIPNIMNFIFLALFVYFGSIIAELFVNIFSKK